MGVTLMNRNLLGAIVEFDGVSVGDLEQSLRAWRVAGNGPHPFIRSVGSGWRSFAVFSAGVQNFVVEEFHFSERGWRRPVGIRSSHVGPGLLETEKLILLERILYDAVNFKGKPVRVHNISHVVGLADLECFF